MSSGKRWHLLGVGLVALVLIGAGTVLDEWLPDDASDPVAAPHVRRAQMGERVDLRTMVVEVERVRAARTLMEFGFEQHSPGVWVVVEYTVVAAHENIAADFAELGDATGRVWSLSGRNENTCPAGPPGVPVGCVVRFEVPLDALDSLRLRLGRDRSDQRYDALAEVDLGFTDADGAAAVDAPVLEVPEPTLGGRS